MINIKASFHIYFQFCYNDKSLKQNEDNKINRVGMSNLNCSIYT